ncbi:hypothetical protein SAMN06295974_3868 [Plantibacter flavus]|uniref:Uncharacterized protein n=1 Tax=Plantibacter flavus TaxID=150123 RepID=A0A3N2BL26_9MICO|nr:hypothetical protein [Plantibacter flavus]ROR75987.1 hypothetical protein EDD42_3938 [Plantibacter flavus]SMG49584.1 hypothetical protein SAMN06295974_3868 [Plantibacter flavus]
MTSPAPTAVAVAPINHLALPLQYPLARISDLSPDARSIHRVVRRRWSPVLDRDVFELRSGIRHVSREEAAVFTPTPRMMTAIRELESQRLAYYSSEYGHQLNVVPVSKCYTYAQGRGSQFIEVHLVGEHQNDSSLLAVIIGGELETRESPGGAHETVIRARHENATDVEHDSSSTAILSMRNMSQPRFPNDGQMEFTAALTSALLYPIDVDPLLADDGSSRPGASCTDCDTPHPFAPYAPPAVDGLPGTRLVSVRARPMRSYLVAEPPAHRAPDQPINSESEIA